MSPRGHAASLTAGAGTTRHRLKRPEFSLLCRDRIGLSGGRGDRRRGGGPRSALLDPVRERGDFGGRELRLFLGGHREIPLVPDRANEQALVRFARHDCRAIVAAAQQCGAAGEAQTPFDLGRGSACSATMALQTMRGQERPDLLFEKLFARRGR